MVTLVDVTWWDVRPVAGVLAAALALTLLGRWLEPDPVVRGQALFHHFSARVREGLRSGVARLVEDHGAVIGAALWLPCTSGDSARRRVPGGAVAEGFAQRYGWLEAAAGQPHLHDGPHLRLVGLGVLPSWQRRGIAAALLADGDHADPARCLITDYPSTTGVYARQGFRAYGVPVALPAGGPVIQPMQHARRARALRFRNASPASYLNSGASRDLRKPGTGPTSAGRANSAVRNRGSTDRWAAPGNWF